MKSALPPDHSAPASTAAAADLEGDVTLGRYGQRGTIRTDVVENVDGRTVCGYDIKTGKADLTLSRARELAGNMMRLYPRATRYLIMQIKPRL